MCTVYGLVSDSPCPPRRKLSLRCAHGYPSQAEPHDCSTKPGPATPLWHQREQQQHRVTTHTRWAMACCCFLNFGLEWAACFWKTLILKFNLFSTQNNYTGKNLNFRFCMIFFSKNNLISNKTKIGSLLLFKSFALIWRFCVCFTF